MPRNIPDYVNQYQLIERLPVSEEARRIALQVLIDPAIDASNEALREIRLGQRDDLPILQAVERALRAGRAGA